MANILLCNNLLHFRMHCAKLYDNSPVSHWWQTLQRWTFLGPYQSEIFLMIFCFQEGSFYFARLGKKKRKVWVFFDITSEIFVVVVVNFVIASVML